MSKKTTLVWLRQDLRLADNPALTAAAAQGPILPIYILDDSAAGPWALGGAARWWLHHALTDVEKNLAAHAVPLILRRGDSLKHLQQIIAATGATRVVWNRRYEPYAIAQDKKIKEALSASGITVESFNARLLVEPWTIANASGEPFRVFTPFWRNVMQKLHTAPPEAPLPVPLKMSAPTHSVESDTLIQWNLLPTRPDWAGGLRATWNVTEGVAQENLASFIDTHLDHYKSERDFPAKTTTSRLSPYLAFGQISPRQCWHGVRTAQHSGRVSQQQEAEHFITEIGWREFAYHLLYHYPQTPTEALYPKFKNFPWLKDDTTLHAWQRGCTGYKLVDAGMRELWQTGWMHNRVRMVVGSFLVKHLLLPWQEGAKWFWDTLVDADLASNTLGWQWVAGCGADAAPYFRVFNPLLQATKFDPENLYIRRYVPEDLPPIVAHDFARKRALEALARIKGL